MEERQRYVWSYPVAFWLLLLVTAVLFGVAFRVPVADMVRIWNAKEEYGYAYLIPVITLFLIWQRKNLLAAIEFRTSLAGLLLMLMGGMLFFLGTLATTHTLSQYGLIVTIMGAAWGVLGWSAFRIVAIPLALMFFMVPFPQFVYNMLSTKLQLISSEIGVAVIRLFDISVYLEGNVIDLGNYKLQVVDACSGLRYLFPLASLSFIAAYIFRGAFWKQAMIFLSSIPITVFMNSFRIGVIGVLVEYGGPEQAEGFLHYFEGWIIFMACMAILMLEMAVLARIGRTRTTLGHAFALDLPDPVPDNVPRKQRALRFSVWLVPLLACGILASSAYIQGKQTIIPERQQLVGFPLELGGWKGKPDRLDSPILDELDVEDYLIADYSNASGELVNFYVAYYDDQAAGESAHSPRSCIPGGGWLIKEHEVVPLGDQVMENGKPHLVNRLLIRKGDYGQLVYYWFQQRGRAITNEWLVKWYLFQDAMARNRTDGALVRFTTVLHPSEDVADADARIIEFAKSALPYLRNYIPD